MAVRVTTCSGVKGTVCTIRAPSAKAKLTWHMYMRSIGAADRFSTSMSISNAVAVCAKDDARRGAIVRAEAHRIFAGAGDGHPGAPLVLPQAMPAFVHLGAGHLAMRAVRVAGAGNAVAQEPGVIGEASIGLNDGLGRARLANMLCIASSTPSNAALQTI